MIIIDFWQPIWPHLENHIKFLRQIRKTVDRSEHSDRIGINISLITTSAFLIESKVETEFRKLLKTINDTINRIRIDDRTKARLKNRYIKNSTNYISNIIETKVRLDEYDDILKLISISNNPSKLSDFEDWEGIKTLFFLRNKLVHGLEIRSRKILGRDDFSGNYKKAEDYLIRNKLITKRIIDVDSVYNFFTNKVSDHFVVKSNKFIKYSEKIFKTELELIK